MIQTEEIFKLVQEEVSSIIEREPTVDKLVGEMKKTVITAMTKNYS